MLLWFLTVLRPDVLLLSVATPSALGAAGGLVSLLGVAVALMIATV
jgi:hypothetical protein